MNQRAAKKARICALVASQQINELLLTSHLRVRTSLIPHALHWQQNRFRDEFQQKLSKQMSSQLVQLLITSGMKEELIWLPR